MHFALQNSTKMALSVISTTFKAFQMLKNSTNLIAKIDYVKKDFSCTLFQN